jgi:hypothetical protein
MTQHLPGSTKPWLLIACVSVSIALVRVAAQTPPPREAPCPRESALFHPCALARAKTFTPPQTPDRHPDLQGIWRGPGSGTENIEEHPKTDDDDGGKSLIVDPADGRIPYQAWAVEQKRRNRPTFVDPNVPCFPSGVPRSMYVPTQIEILEHDTTVLILLERAHTYRIIPTDGRTHVGAGVRLWQGDSIGRWDGNTLVVDVTNQSAKTWFDQAGNFLSSAAHLTERFTLIDPDTIHYQVTIDDPQVYTRPWTMAFPLARNRQKGFRLLEEACHEGERNTDRLLRMGQKIYPGATPPSRSTP